MELSQEEICIRCRDKPQYCKDCGVFEDLPPETQKQLLNTEIPKPFYTDDGDLDT